MFILPERFKPFFSVSSPAFLAIVVIVLIGFLFSLGLSIKRAVDIPTINFEEVDFPTSDWKNRIIQKANTAAAEKDSAKRFELYRQIFRNLLTLYTANHNSETRLQTEALVQFMAKEFPNAYNPKNFNIPCLDLACGSPNYPKEIEEIKEELKNVGSLDPLLLDSLNKKFEAAALSGESDSQWFNYLGAFQEIKSAKERAGDAKLGQVAQKFKDFLEANYPKRYGQWEQMSDTFKL